MRATGPLSAEAAPGEELPRVLVSAVDAAAATAFITELIGEDGEPRQAAGNSNETSQVWRLSNKYYSARVRVEYGAAAARAGEDVHAHIVLLQPCQTEVDLETLVTNAGPLPICDVKLALLTDATEEGALGAAARRHGYEPVPMLAPASDEGPEGLARAREALHAHVWPGLQLNNRPGPTPRAMPVDDDEWQWQSAGDRETDGRNSESGMENGDSVTDNSVGAGERLNGEMGSDLAELLGALGSARELVGSAGAGRVARAGALLAAFWHAMPDDPPDER